MPKRLKRRPSPAMAVAMLALFIALGGTAVAARVLITSSKQIKAGVVSRSDLRKSAVNSAKVANGSLTLDDLDANAKGSIQTAGTQALEAFRIAGPSNVAMNTKQKVATLANIPPGAYAIFAKTILTASGDNQGLLAQGASIGGHCILDAEGDTDESRVLLGTPGANSPGGLNMQITRSFAGPGTASLSCEAQSGWSATNTSIIALRVGASPRQSVPQR